MSATEQPKAARPQWIGVSAAVLGLLGLAGFAWTWWLSAGPADPPDWLRIVGVWLMPIGAFGGLAAGFAGLRGRGRPWAIVGLVASAATILAFVLLIAVSPY